MKKRLTILLPQSPETAYPRDFLGNRFIYVVMSTRIRGLSVEVNMNPDKSCNFDCLYCAVNRYQPAREPHLDVGVMAAELRRTLAWLYAGRLRDRPGYGTLPGELLQPRQVALSGDGEPTFCPNFVEVVQAVQQVRALGDLPFFKLVLITNAAGLELPAVRHGLKLFTNDDEVWAKLDAGTQAYMDKVNRPDCSIEKVLANILTLGRRRRVVIQSLFPLLNEEEPPNEEIEQYILRLQELVSGGAQISLVQVYSATRTRPHSECAHLPPASLSRIAQAVRNATGLRVEAF